jgi:hypothetical protein
LHELFREDSSCFILLRSCMVFIPSLMSEFMHQYFWSVCSCW